MDLKDIFSYIGTYGGILLVGGASLATLNLVFQITAQAIFQGRRIRNEELEKVVEAEARKLGLDPSRIDIRRSTTCQVNRVKKEGNRYGLYLDEDCTMGNVRHELYHIKKDCDREFNDFRYFLIGEPRAILYGCFGIKI